MTMVQNLDAVERKSPLVVSIHIPKTAGSSFKNALQDVYGPRLLLDYEDRPLSTSLSHCWQRCRNKFYARINSRLLEREYDAIHGHYLASKYAWLGSRAALCIFLRDPVDRLISHHRFWTNRPDRKNAMWRKFHKDGMNPCQLASLPRQRHIYSLFTNNLPMKRFTFVGLQGEYETSLQLFRAIFSVNVTYSRVNVGNNIGDSIDKSQQKIPKKINPENYLVYDEARRRFEEFLRHYLA